LLNTATARFNRAPAKPDNAPPESAGSLEKISQTDARRTQRGRRSGGEVKAIKDYSGIKKSRLKILFQT
jgi:hypothetical protein